MYRFRRGHFALGITPYHGIDQWEFRGDRSCRNLGALLISRWILALDNCKIAPYLLDISGAFDCVDNEFNI